MSAAAVKEYLIGGIVFVVHANGTGFMLSN